MFNYRDYLAFSEKYIDLAEDGETFQGSDKFLLIPSTILAWIAIEAFVNSMLEDFSSLPEDLFQLHERAFLLEKKLKFVSEGKNIGEFMLDNQPEYRRLEDKIFFLIAKFGSNKENIKGDTLWQKFERFKDVRNDIMHPRKNREVEISIDNAKEYFSTSVELIKFISLHVWGKAVDI